MKKEMINDTQIFFRTVLTEKSPFEVIDYNVDSDNYQESLIVRKCVCPDELAAGLKKHGSGASLDFLRRVCAKRLRARREYYIITKGKLEGRAVKSFLYKKLK